MIKDMINEFCNPQEMVGDESVRIEDGECEEREIFSHFPYKDGVDVVLSVIWDDRPECEGLDPIDLATSVPEGSNY